MSKLITALPVERTEDGYFCHPAYSDLFRGRDGISQEAYDGWLKENNLGKVRISGEILLG